MEVSFPVVLALLQECKMHLCWKNHVLTNMMPHWPNHVSHLAEEDELTQVCRQALSRRYRPVFFRLCVLSAQSMRQEPLPESFLRPVSSLA